MRPRLRALTVVGLLLLAGLAPVVLSNVNDEFGDLLASLPGIDEPSTGDATLDDALAAAFDRLSPAHEALESLQDALGEPQQPATYFWDFEFGPEPTDRIGGWGQWQETGDAGWMRDAGQPRIGSHRESFASQDGYPVTSRDLDAYLVSPRISLDSIPTPQGDLAGIPDDRLGAALQQLNQELEDAPELPLGFGLDPLKDLAGSDVDLATGTLADQERILLYLTHRFHFAHDAAGGAALPGRDGGRVELFTAPPTPALLAQGGVVLRPVADAYQPTQAFDDPNVPGSMEASAFTGNRGTAVDAFDLSRWAGRDVWLVFHAATEATFSGASSYFTNPRFFDLSATNRGWNLEQVRIEGPAPPHNLQLDEILQPAFSDDAGRRLASPGPASFAILALNRGQFSEDVASFATVEEQGRLVEECEGPELRLRPGETRAIAFPDCGVLEAGHVYEVRFALLTASEDIDVTADNQRTVEVRALQSPRVVQAGPATLTPALSDESTLRRFTIPLRNPGFELARVDLQATIEAQVGDEWTDVSQDPAAVRFAGAAQQTVLVPADPGDVANRVNATWSVQLLAPGNYRVVARGMQDGQPILEAQAPAGTLVGLPPFYATTFDDPAATDEDTIVAGPPGSPWRQWTTEGTTDILPPQCTGQMAGRACPQELWELPRRVPAELRSHDNTNDFYLPTNYLLIGRAASASADLVFTSLDVEVQSYFEELGCRPTVNSGQCGGELSELGPATVTVNVGRFTDTASPGMRLTATDSAFAPEGSGKYTLQNVAWSGTSGSSTPVQKFSYLDGQWIDDKYRIDLGAPLPASQADRLDLEFRMRLNGELNKQPTSADECPDVQEDAGDAIEPYCPVWRIAYARVVGRTDSGVEAEILRFDGTGAGRGTWTSLVARSPEEMSQCAPGQVPCPGWAKRPSAGLVNGALSSPWHHFDSLPGVSAGQGAWYNGDVPAGQSTLYRREGNQSGLLISPALRIPEADVDDDPVLSFQHLFHLARSTQETWPATHDGGVFMVRMLEQTATGVQPSTPFLPVVLQSISPSGPSRFWADDCRYYATHPVLNSQEIHPSLDYDLIRSGNINGAIAACQSIGFAGRSMPTHAFRLRELAVLGYHDQAGWPGSYVAAGTSNPDPGALETGDLLDGRDDGKLDLRGKLVQFAFKSDVRSDPSLVAAIPSGWAVGSFRIDSNRAPAYDLAVTEASLSADYDWVGLGLGPGTDATLRIGLHNKGMFRAAGIVLNVTLVPEGGSGPITTLVPLDAVALRPNDVVRVDVPFTVPQDPGFYRFFVTANLTGDILPGMPIVDDNLNHCASVGYNGTARVVPACSLANAYVLRVQAVEDLSIDLDVTPLAGREGFARTVDVTVANHGNVVVHDAKLRLLYKSSDGRDQRIQTWTLVNSPAPGEATDLNGLDLDRAPESTLTLERVARYVIQAAVYREGGFQDVDQVQAESFETFYSDRFEPGELTTMPGVVSGQLTPLHPGWAQAKGINMPGDPGTRSWHFGEAKNGTVPDDADAVLRLPSVDLSTASRAVLSFGTRYDLETGFDGGRLEACLAPAPGAECPASGWVPLQPKGGYPGTLQADTPLNDPDPDARDPTRVIQAFTGNSTREAPLTDGWTIPEFEIGQLPGITAPLTVREFDQSGYPTFEERSPVRPDQATTFLRQWCDAGSADDNQCWQRTNLNHRSPPVDPDGRQDGQMWWSGGAKSGQGVTRIDLDIGNVNLVNLDSDALRLSFWAWRDNAAAPLTTVHNGLGQGFTLAYKVAGVTNPQPPLNLVPVYVDPATGWAFYQTDFAKTSTSLELDALRFTYKDADPQGNTGNAPNRGAVIDGVLFQNITFLSGGRVGVLDETAYPAGHTKWGAPTGAAPVAWSRVGAIPVQDTPDAWRPYAVEAGQSADGDASTAWLFGNASASDEASRRYPRNALERLATPFLSLQEVGGASASLVYWESYDIPARTGGFGDTRRIYLQALEPDLDGQDVPGEWTLLRTVAAGATALRSEGSNPLATDAHCDRSRIQNDWCRVELPLDPSYIGKRVRFAFEFESGRQPTIVCSEPPVTPCASGTYLDPDLGFHWLVDHVSLEAQSIVGGTVHLRLRAATDGSIPEGGWSVDNPQLVGFRYKRNVAVLLEGGTDERLVAPGSPLTLSGTLRNTSTRVEQGLVLQARLEPLRNAAGQLAPVVPLSFASGLEGEGAPLRSTPLTLGPAGSLSSGGAQIDRAAFAVRLDVPEACIECRYRITVEVLAPGPNGDLQPLEDDLAGDHARQVGVLAVVRNAVEVTAPTIDRPTLASGQSLNATFVLRNAGTTAAQVTPRLFATLADGAPAQAAVAPAVSLQPGQSAPVKFEWTPSEGGFYRLDAALEQQFAGQAPSTRTTRLGHALVDALPIYYRDGFEAGETWQAITPEARSPAPPCDPGANLVVVVGGSSAPTPWRRVTGSAYEGNASFFIGADSLDEAYPPGRDEMLAGPWVDLGMLADLQEETGTSSPFEPTLAFRYRTLLNDPNNGVVVQAGVRDAPGSEFGPAVLPGPPGAIGCRNPLVSTALQPAPGQPPSRPAFTGSDESPSWKVANVPLAPVVLGDGAGGEQELAMVGRQVQPILRLGTATSAFGFHVDAVSISSYKASVLPAVQQVELRTGSDKTFRFQVANTGAAADRFTLTVDAGQTSPEFGQDVSADVLTPSFQLEAGESATAAVRIEVPDRFDLPSMIGAELVLRLASEADPNQVAVAVLRVSELVRTPLPDLEVDIRPASGGSTQLDEQQDPAGFIAVVDNVGDAPSRATDLVILACHRQDTPAADLAACLQQRRDGDTGPTAPILVRSFKVPALRPQGSEGSLPTRFAPPFSWSPPLGSAGEWRLVAIADTKGAIRQYAPDGTVDLLDLDIRSFQQPDLVAEGLRLLTPAGQPVTTAFDGDLVRVEGRVRNAGNVAARDVQVVLTAQFELRRERIPSLAPGESFAIATTWQAQAGNYLVSLQAQTPTPLDDLANNAMRIPFAVRSGDVTASFEPGAVALLPGSFHVAALRVANQRTTPVDVRLEAVLPPDLSLKGLPEVLHLDRASSQALPLTVEASPFAAVASHRVEVRLVTAIGDAALAAATLDVAVGDAGVVEATLQPLLVAPGTWLQELTLANRATTPAEATLSATVPIGWSIDLPAPRVLLAPGQAKAVPYTLTVPDQTQPGAYNVTFKLGAKALGNLSVAVTESPDWLVQVEARRDLGDALQLVVRVTNNGNAPATPSFDLQPGTTVDPAPFELRPGESEVFVLQSASDATVAMPDGARQGLAPAVPGQVELLDWSLSEGQPGVGERLVANVTVRNPGAAPLLGVPVKLYLDGGYAGGATVDLAPYATASVEIPLTARAGAHAVSVAAGDDLQSASTRLYTAEPRDAPLPLWLLLAALAAALVARRRRA